MCSPCRVKNPFGGRAWMLRHAYKLHLASIGLISFVLSIAMVLFGLGYVLLLGTVSCGRWPAAHSPGLLDAFSGVEAGTSTRLKPNPLPRHCHTSGAGRAAPDLLQHLQHLRRERPSRGPLLQGAFCGRIGGNLRLGSFADVLRPHQPQSRVSRSLRSHGTCAGGSVCPDGQIAGGPRPLCCRLGHRATSWVRQLTPAPHSCTCLRFDPRPRRYVPIGAALLLWSHLMWMLIVVSSELRRPMLEHRPRMMPLVCSC